MLSKGVDIDNVRVTADLDSSDQKTQDVLVDFTFRGDNSPSTRRYFMSDLNEGAQAFKKTYPIRTGELLSVFH